MKSSQWVAVVDSGQSTVGNEGEKLEKGKRLYSQEEGLVPHPIAMHSWEKSWFPEALFFKQ